MAKRKIVWSSNAEVDLLKILEYFHVRNGSKTYSVKLNSRIRKVVRHLGNHPFLGLQSDVENVRALVEGGLCHFLSSRQWDNQDYSNLGLQIKSRFPDNSQMTSSFCLEKTDNNSTTFFQIFDNILMRWDILGRESSYFLSIFRGNQ